MNKKTCRKCGVEQVPENFRKGYTCRVCEREYQKEYRNNNKEYHKKWREKNPDKVKGYNDKFRLANPNYNKEYLRGDDKYRVYVIEAEWKGDKFYYVGNTIKQLNYRLSAHLTAKTTTGFGKWIQNKKNHKDLTRLEIREVGIFDCLDKSTDWEKEVIGFFARHQGQFCLNKHHRGANKC
tara:strand:+ start:360 stop:899 length:540 start_codon:yes stop_codon:yes gene_type:complete